MRLVLASRLAAVAVTAATVIMAVGQAASAAPAGGDGTPFLGPLHTVTAVASTVPANGDLNPYGTALVDKSSGDLRHGNVLVSNFNNAANQQGTGTTLVQVSPRGTTSLFARKRATSSPSTAATATSWRPTPAAPRWPCARSTPAAPRRERAHCSGLRSPRTLTGSTSSTTQPTR
jgi:hypothetical protein